MNENKYTKMSELVNQEFTVEKVDGYKFKFWDSANKKMLVSETFEKGYRKVYGVETDRGKLDLGSGQLGSLLESVQHAGQANLIGVVFQVKSNGKTGMDIRYFFNPQRIAKVDKPSEVSQDSFEYDESNIGF